MLGRLTGGNATHRLDTDHAARMALLHWTPFVAVSASNRFRASFSIRPFRRLGIFAFGTPVQRPGTGMVGGVRLTGALCGRVSGGTSATAVRSVTGGQDGSPPASPAAAQFDELADGGGSFIRTAEP